MDFLDPKKRRYHTVRLFVGYGLVGIALLIGTGILAFYVNGYTVNRKTGDVIQNGLVFIDAHPDTANIYLNGKPIGKTSSRQVIAEGKYSVELKRTGYRNWKKDFTLAGGQVVRLVYPLLFPNKLTSSDVKTYDSPIGLVTQSPDRRWLIEQHGSSLTDFDLFDLNASEVTPTKLTLPTTLLTPIGGASSLEVIEWSSDNKHLLLKHTFANGTEYAMVDREAPAASQNLTQFFARPTARISLKDKKYDQYFLYEQSTQQLSGADLKSKTVTPLIEKVLSFKPHSAETVVYSTPTGASAGNVMIKVLSGKSTYNLRQVAASDTYLLDVAKFDGHWYMVGGSNKEGRIYIFRDPVETIKQSPKLLPTPLALLKLSDPRFESFSSTAGYLAIQSGSNFAVYDIEQAQITHYDSKLKLDPSYKATWMDGNRLTAVSDGKLNVFDFDGTNSQELVNANPNYEPAFDRDYKTLYTIAPSTVTVSRNAINKTSLKLN